MRKQMIKDQGSKSEKRNTKLNYCIKDRTVLTGEYCPNSATSSSSIPNLQFT